MDRIYDLYEIMKPIAELIEKNKTRIEVMISDIEDDKSVSDEQWKTIEELESSLLNLSFSGGDTSMNELKNMAEIDTDI